MGEPLDPWSGRQPRYEGLACDGAGRFFLVARLPSGEAVRAQLRRVSASELRRLVVAGVEGEDG